MKQITLKSLLLTLLVLLAGAAPAWGEQVITSTFKQSQPYNAGMTLQCVEDNALSWVTSAKPNGYEASGSARGMQWSNIATTLTASAPKGYVVSKVVVTVASNSTLADTYKATVKVGGVEYGSQKITKSLTPLEFTGNSTGDIVIATAKGNKSTYIKSITITIEESPSGGGGEGVPAPILSLAEGTYTEAQELTIGIPEGAAGVLYTTDGEDPTDDKNNPVQITEDIKISISSTTTIRAVAFNKDKEYSKESSRIYTIVQLQSIAIEGKASKTLYVNQESFDMKGLSVVATYNNSSTKDVTSEAVLSANPEVMAEGTTQVTVTATYKNMQASKVVDVTVVSEVNTVKIDLTKDKTTTATTEKLEWMGEIVTVTANKGKGDNDTNANNYYPGTKNYSSTRFYTNSTLTFSPAPLVAILQITYEATSDNYAKAMADSKWENATASYTGKTVTIKPTDGREPITATIKATTGGSGFSFTYTYADAAVVNLGAEVGEYHYATFSSTCACEFADAEVYTVSVDDDALVLNEIGSKQVPAGTGVLVKSTKGKAKVTSVQSASAIEQANLLQPASKDMAEMQNYTFYKLAYNDFKTKTGLGFYYGAAEGAAFNVKAGTAYLAVPAAQAASVKGFRLDDIETGIGSVEAENSDKAAIYNLQGQRVQKGQRGIYIVNGKKYMVK